MTNGKPNGKRPIVVSALVLSLVVVVGVSGFWMYKNIHGVDVAGPDLEIYATLVSPQRDLKVVIFRLGSPEPQCVSKHVSILPIGDHLLFEKDDVFAEYVGGGNSLAVFAKWINNDRVQIRYEKTAKVVLAKDSVDVQLGIGSGFRKRHITLEYQPGTNVLE